METALATIVSGLVLGSIYALMASGLSVVWTTLGVFNFAHGAMMALGALLAWSVAEAAGLGVLPGIVAAVAVLALVGAVMERLLVRPFYGNRNMLLITVVTTLAGMIFLEKSMQMIWGARSKQIDPVLEGGVRILGVTISAQEFIIIVVAPVVLLVLWAFLSRSRLGRSIRAVGQNPKAASLLGVNVERQFMATFALAAALAGLTGALLGAIRFITPTMGNEPLVKALVVVIFGGLGSLGGTIGAAYVIGFLEAFLIAQIGFYWTPSVLFAVMIVVLLMRPAGLFGRRG